MTEVKSEQIETKTKREDDLEASATKKFVWTKDRIVLAIIFTVIVLISVALLVVILVDKTFLFDVVRNYFILPLIDIHVAWRVLLFLVLMVIQSLFAPIPSELILLSGGMIFGLWWGSVIGVAGSMLSAAITYYLAKRGGRAIVDAAGQKVKIIDRTILIFDEWIKKWGLWAIIVGRAVPMIMFDPISYAAGISEVKDSHYFIATFLGSIPRAAFYSYFGVQLLGNNPISYIKELTQEEIESVSDSFNTWFFIIFGVLVAMFVLSNVIYYLRERKKKQEKQLELQEENVEKDSIEKTDEIPTLDNESNNKSINEEDDI
jgi:uncharacterized membrane protein YdjX (TVP38/TMEM64 family)